MKRTNVVLDEKKLNRAKKICDIHTTKEIIDLALTELIRAYARQDILSIKGKIDLDIDLNTSRRTRG